MTEKAREAIVLKHYPDSYFDECTEWCMRCDEGQCKAKDLSRESLRKDLQAYADQEVAEVDLQLCTAESEMTDLKAEVERLREHTDRLSLWLHNEHPEVYKEYFIQELKKSKGDD